MSNTILITGGSRGIGAATAIEAATKNYKVCINYLKNRDAAMKVVDTIQSMGRECIALQADVSNENEVKDLFKRLDDYGKLTALVNNAGILERQMRFETMDPQRWQKVFNNNVLSTFLCTKEAIKRMSIKHGGEGGSIVNVSSIAALTGSPGEYTDYAASKGAIDTFTIGVAKEVASEKIRINGVRPAFIYTDIHASGGEPGRVDRVKDLIPMQRGGKPEEVAKAILWLLSDEASYSTGTFIDVSGGK